MSNLLASIQAEQRARANYLPYCCICSFPTENILIRPSFRLATLKGGVEVVKLTGCCRLSTPDDDVNLFESEAAAAQWWRARRLEPHPDIAVDERRRLNLARFAAAQLEPFE